MRRVLHLLFSAVLLLPGCGSDVQSLEKLKPVCEVYQDCFALGKTPEGCCPHSDDGGWDCFNWRTDKRHCGDCETTCAVACCDGACIDGECGASTELRCVAALALA